MQLMKSAPWITLVLVITAASAFAEGQKTTMNPLNQGSEAPLTEVKVRDLNRHPDKFAGQEVMVSGKVDRIERPGSFLFNGTGFFNNKIFVVVAPDKAANKSGQKAGMAAPIIREGQKLQLSGKVEELDITKVEERYGPLKAEIKAEFEGTMPILVVVPSGVKPTS